MEKLWEFKAWLWRHLAIAAQITDALHAAEPSVRNAAAGWRQSQSLDSHRFFMPYKLEKWHFLDLVLHYSLFTRAARGTMHYT